MRGVKRAAPATAAMPYYVQNGAKASA